ncbi:MAG: type IV-A pilus assembly ATPase PilB [Patescibacteria group bacterium]
MITVRPRKQDPNAPADPNQSLMPSITVISPKKALKLSRLRKDVTDRFVEAEVQSRAEVTGYPYFNLYGFPVDAPTVAMIDEATATSTKIGVFSRNNFELYLATPYPGIPGQQEIISNFNQQGFNCTIYLVSENSFQKILDTYKRIQVTPTGSDKIEIDEENFSKLETEFATLDQFSEIVHKVSLTELVELLFAGAVKYGASDIHLEPEKDSVHLRYRLDGVLQTFAILNIAIKHQLESRIKLLSHLKLNIDNVPQDGRLSFKVGQTEYDVRVSMLPSNYGYSIVMRLLGVGAPSLKLEDLGFVGVAKERIEIAISKPQGMILTTGPTGSGKTTTLYSFLTQMNDGTNKIITLEDPIEYKLPGVSQTQIDAPAGYTFASGLRSILRQDPDVVMVGEIRDPETADTAVQASLTGHLVLSTLHTNDAAGAIPRLMDMDVKGFILSDSLSAIIAQRLVRKICPYCKVQDTNIPQEYQRRIREALGAINQDASGIAIDHNLHFFTSTGCEKCNGLGYKGRIGCYEVLTMVDDMRVLLAETTPSMVEIRRIAAKNGMLNMFQDAVVKALQGITDLKEIFRVIG